MVRTSLELVLLVVQPAPYYEHMVTIFKQHLVRTDRESNLYLYVYVVNTMYIFLRWFGFYSKNETLNIRLISYSYIIFRLLHC